ncbi:hypothetical protein HY640_00560 [Candidatus Woesearchaeota archaeon]|nr:hypothetical protein [Candidatus Woesearchaeota archaeon]
MRGRKGQFYLLMVLLLVVFLFGVVSPESELAEPSGSFRALYSSFEAESPSVINSGIYDGNMSSRFLNFSGSYLDYSSTRDPGFGFAYALLGSGSLLVENRLPEAINATTPEVSVSVPSGSHVFINRSKNLTFYIGGTAYGFVFSREPELKAVFRKSEKKEVLVHVRY